MKIENAFVMLKNKWQVLKNLNFSVLFFGQVILTYYLLHNLIYYMWIEHINLKCVQPDVAFLLALKMVDHAFPPLLKRWQQSGGRQSECKLPFQAASLTRNLNLKIVARFRGWRRY